MKLSNTLAAGAVVAALVLGALVWWRQPTREAPADAPAPAPSREPEPTAAPNDDSPSSTARESREHPQAQTPDEGPPAPEGQPRIDRVRWSELKRALEEAHPAASSPEERELQAAIAAAAASGEPVGTLSPEYIQQSIEELIPLLGECFELAQEDEGDPELRGRLLVRFTIVGDEEIGGIVEESSIDERSELQSPLLQECVRETLYTLELPAPEGGGRVTVTYPFSFSPEDE